MTVTDEIKARLNLEDIVAETVKLRRSGRSMTGFCPFHPNTHTPAFVVFPDTGTWRCFGQCNEGGDIFKYIMKREGMDFSQALKYLAERAGVQLAPPTPEMERTRHISDRLENALELAVQFFHSQLLESPAGRSALDYLHKRDLKDATLEQFGFGYAPDSWDSLQKHLIARGIDPQAQIECGLLTEREGGGYYDRFRNRIMIPIRTMEGKMAGFGARILNPQDQPKFLNSPQTILFDKGRLLFGLDRARKAIRLQDQAVIVEGYLDVVALHQAGFANAVSPMGTALTEDQMRLLKKFTRRIVLALDADAAGEKATLRGLEVAREAMDHGEEIGFDVRGLLRHEKRLQADLRVTTLPEGMDPDEVVNRDPAEWQGIVDRATPLVIHVMESLARSKDVTDPRVKNEIAAAVLPLIEDVPGTVERDAYRQRLARLLRVGEEALLSMHPARQASLPSGRRVTNQPNPQSPRQVLRAGTTDPTPEMERHVLAWLISNPPLLYRVDRNLRQTDLPRLSGQDFGQSDLQQAFFVLNTALEQDELDPQEYIAANLDASLLTDLTKFFDFNNQDKINEDDLVVDVFRTVIRLRNKRCKDALLQLRYLQEDEHPEGSTVPFQNQVLENLQMIKKLESALRLDSQKRKL